LRCVDLYLLPETCRRRTFVSTVTSEDRMSEDCLENVEETIMNCGCGCHLLIRIGKGGGRGIGEDGVVGEVLQAIINKMGLVDFG
jgi:hypothetical protein